MNQKFVRTVSLVLAIAMAVSLLYSITFSLL